MRSSWLLLTSLLLSAPLRAADIEPPTATARGDLAWQRRGEGQESGRAAPGPIAEAVSAYEEALRADPANLEVYWKLMRALWFQGQYATSERSAQQQVFEHGKQVGEEAINRLAQRTGGRSKLDALAPAELATSFGQEPAAAPVFFWSAVHWGLWGDAFGRLAAARQGVAGKVRDRCLIVLALDEHLEQGGAHRVLGRLHALAPKVPFFTGWIDRDTAISQLRSAVELGPEEPLNPLYLAEALIEYRRDERSRAEALLRGIIDHPLNPERVTEWSAAKARAQALLQAPP
jgi:tetratricopeptide (TPR) repeat protein